MNSGSCLVAILVLAFIVLTPFITLWAINVLWNLQNPYDFTHWSAALLLLIGGSLFGGLFSSSKSKE